MSFLRFTEESKERLFTAAGAGAAAPTATRSARSSAFFDAEAAEDLVDRMLNTDLMTRMPDHLLAITDRMSMAHSLEVRPPLMDYRLVEYAASIPGDLKLRGRTLKYILKKVAARYLPPELITRPKQGFGFPIARWMRTELAAFLRNLFARSRFVELGPLRRRVHATPCSTSTSRARPTTTSASGSCSTSRSGSATASRGSRSSSCAPSSTSCGARRAVPARG